MSPVRPARALVAATVAIVVALLAAGPAGALASPSPGAARAATAVAPLPAPTGITVTRDPADPMNFVVRWTPITNPALHHVNVSVFTGTTDDVVVVPAGTNELRVKGTSWASRYRITVSSRDAAGTGTSSGYVWLHPAIPGAPTALAATRVGAPLTGLTVTWAAPAWSGFGPAKGYRVLVTRMSDAVVVSDTTTPDLAAKLDGLDVARQYSVKVTAVNGYGESAAAGTTVGSAVPNTPTGIVAERDAVDPALVRVRWVAPAYTGFGPIDRYEVVYGPNTLNTTTTVKAGTTSTEVKIVGSITGLVAVRACNTFGCGYLGTTAKAPPVGVVIPAGPSTSTSPYVGIDNKGGVITVETKGVIGSVAKYPRLVVRVTPTLTSTFTDVQWGQNGAQLMTFRTVPTGTYWVVVHGVTPAGAEEELARKLVVVGDDGLLQPAEWQVIRGKADISARTVDLPYAGENRVLSVKPRQTQDMALTTNATLKSGSGYGVWFRTSLDAKGLVNGYTFQYDPMYGNKFIIRHWYNGTECGTPLATSPFPKGFAENGEHKLVVVAKGDTVWASVDGIEMFRVASLKAAIAASPCRYPEPTGTRIGFRTWSTSPATFVGTTLS